MATKKAKTKKETLSKEDMLAGVKILKDELKNISEEDKIEMVNMLRAIPELLEDENLKLEDIMAKKDDVKKTDKDEKSTLESLHIDVWTGGYFFLGAALGVGATYYVMSDKDSTKTKK